MSPVKSFNWTNLKRVSGEEIRLTDSLISLIPDTSVRDTLGISVRKMLMKHLGEKSFYYLDAVTTEPFAAFLAALPENAILATIGMEPSAAKAVLYIDANLAFLIIDRLLGGEKEPSVETRRLYETEQGVLQYFIMQVLAEIWRSCGSASRVHFRFDRFSSGGDIEKLGTVKDVAISLVFKVGIGEFSGFVKAVFPGAFIGKAVTGKEIEPPFELDYFVNNAGRYGYLPATIWADAGHAIVSSADLISLEEGDVVIFDESGLMLKDGVPEGSVDLKVGRGEEGALKADAKIDGKILRCIVK